ncbi:hypothetical protein DFH08DRAFT_799592 [Mycena albidolilacea]|uniref:Uncharacterized protein n=1 Tax=Mycena albidolilacea TaxID=1033008 RepID=A0AAD7ALP3_9AGAR|nr:hypothetical protein DFH08DRAFT_799592 [Mycena albidolilacea]
MPRRHLESRCVGFCPLCLFPVIPDSTLMWPWKGIGVLEAAGELLDPPYPISRCLGILRRTASTEETMEFKTIKAACIPETGVVPRTTSIAATMDITVEGKIGMLHSPSLVAVMIVDFGRDGAPVFWHCSFKKEFAEIFRRALRASLVTWYRCSS